MPNSPTSGKDAILSRSGYLQFGDPTTDTRSSIVDTSPPTSSQVTTYGVIELYSWNLREDKRVAETPFGADVHISYGRGPAKFDFSAWASEDLASRLEVYNAFTKVNANDAEEDAVVPLVRWHLKIVTQANLEKARDRVRYINFTGRIRSLATSRQGGQETRVAVACGVDLQDENYIATTQLAGLQTSSVALSPVYATSRS